MKTLAVYEVKTNLSNLLDQVEAGQEIQITRRGIPIARIVAEHAPVKADFSALIAQLKSSRHQYSLDDTNWHDAMAEGRD